MTSAEHRIDAPRVGVAIATRERHDDLAGALERLCALPERPPVVVADNGSRDGTPARVRARFPRVALLQLGENPGAGARDPAGRARPAPHVPVCGAHPARAPGGPAARAGP